MGRSNLRWWLIFAGALVVAAVSAPPPPRVQLELRLSGQRGFTLVLGDRTEGGDVYGANLALPANAQLSVVTEFPADVTATSFWM